MKTKTQKQIILTHEELVQAVENYVNNIKKENEQVKLELHEIHYMPAEVSFNITN